MGLTPPENLDDDQLVYWKELVNRVHAAVAATETPDEPTLEQVEVLAANVPGVDDPETGFSDLPDGWDASTVAEVWSKVGGSFTACKTKFTTEENWSERKADRFCAALKDEVKGSEQWREGGGQQPGPFSMVPGVPNNPDRITRAMLEDIARFKMNSLVEQARTAASLPPLSQTLNETVQVAADWNPSLHPRGPDGKFVERPWDMNIGVEDINSAPTHKLVQFLGEADGQPDMDRVLSDDSISIDGIPESVNSVDELKATMDDPELNEQVPSNPKDFGELNEGDVVSTPAGPGELVNKEVTDDGQVLELERPSGRTFKFNMTDFRRNTVDVYDVDAVDELPSEGGSGGEDFPSVDDLTPGNPNFVDDKNGAEVGDFVRVDPKGLADRNEPFVGKVTERRFEGAEYTVKTPNGDELDVGAGEPRRVEGYLPADPEGGDGDSGFPDPSDPEDGRWKTEGVISPDEGDMVRFNSPRKLELEVGRVVDEGGMGAARVQTEDGKMFRVSPNPDPDSNVNEFKGVFEPDDAGVDPTQLKTADDRNRVDLTELDGSPAERREAVKGETVGEVAEEHVTNEEIPEGVVLAKGNRDNPFTYEVLDTVEDTLGNKELKIRSETGRTRTLSADIAARDYEYYEPGDVPEVTIPDSDWGDEDTARSQRSQAIRSILDDVLPNGGDSPDGNSDGNLDRDTFDAVKDTIAQQLARSNNKEHAEKVAARLTSVGQRDRAHAVEDISYFGPNTAYFSVDNDEDEDVVIHELGHAVGDIYGLKGGSNDMDGQTYPMPDFAWNSPDYDVPQKYGMKEPQWSDDFEPETNIRAQPSFNLDDWKDEVDAQVGTGLDGRNFTSADDVNDIPRQEGAMVRLEDEPAYGDGKIWRITELGEQEDFMGEKRQEVTLESKDGKTASGLLENKFDDPAISWDSDSPYRTSTRIDGKRNESPDNWREDPPDPDEWLGSEDIADADEAMRNLGDKVNKAWYRQAAASREQGTREASDYSLLGGYSAKQAHETMSRVHHAMTPGGADTGRKIDNEKRAEAAMALVKYHPDLLEAYRNVYDIPVAMEQALNAVLEQEGADFRFDTTAPMSVSGVETPVDAVKEIYEGAEA